MPNRPIPAWVDRRTALWCAELCEGLAERLEQRWPAASERRIGLEAAGGSIRALVMAARPMPTIVPFPVRRAEGANDG